jgi:hypothetical protein
LMTAAHSADGKVMSRAVRSAAYLAAQMAESRGQWTAAPMAETKEHSLVGTMAGWTVAYLVGPMGPRLAAGKASKRVAQRVEC